MEHGTLSFVEDVKQHVDAAMRIGIDSCAPHITVHVCGTCVTLKGDVHDWAQHERAENAALSVPGVDKVDNQLAILVKAKPSSR